MGLFDSFKKKDEEIDDIMEIGEIETDIWGDETDIAPQTTEEEPESGAKFSGINESAVSLKIVTLKSLSESDKIADYLIEGSSVVLNIEEIGADDVIRFMDYLRGVLYVINGKIKQVSKTTFVATPNNVGIDSENGVE